MCVAGEIEGVAVVPAAKPLLLEVLKNLPKGYHMVDDGGVVGDDAGLEALNGERVGVGYY